MRGAGGHVSATGDMGDGGGLCADTRPTRDHNTPLGQQRAVTLKM